MAEVQRGGHFSDVISSTIALADIRIAQGRLGEAMRAYEQALQLAQVEGEPPLQGTADLYVGMSELHCEQNDLNAAERCLRSSKELGEHTGLPQNRSRWYVAMARIRKSQGDLDSALELLLEAERLYVGDLFPNVRPIAALKARLWVNQGRLGEALGWARAQGLSVDDTLAYLREFEHITLARILLAQHQHAPAEHSLLAPLGLLDRLLQVAQAGKRTGSVIEILILQALAYQTQGNTSAALTSLKDALTLAEPEGYIRIFVDEGLPMRRLLAEGRTHGAESDPEWSSHLQLYADKLLSAFAKGNEEAQAQATASVRTQTTPAPATIHALVESLSERELEVLRLLASDLSGPEIARQLMVSLNTLRTHTKNIFSKHSVNNRRAAIHRAEELALL